MLFFLMICSQEIFFFQLKKKDIIAWAWDDHSRCDPVCRRVTRRPGQDADVAGLRVASRGRRTPQGPWVWIGLLGLRLPGSAARLGHGA